MGFKPSSQRISIFQSNQTKFGSKTFFFYFLEKKKISRNWSVESKQFYLISALNSIIYNWLMQKIKIVWCDFPDLMGQDPCHLAEAYTSNLS
jgi:hypothetical protein